MIRVHILKIKDKYDIKDPWILYIINAIKAKALYSINVHYITQNNQIIIVDEFTRCIMPDGVKVNTKQAKRIYQFIKVATTPIRASPAVEYIISISFVNQ